MKSLALPKGAPGKKHWIAAGVAAAIAYLLFVHPDVMETANHSYLLLESTFSGRFLDFYHDVMAHDNTLYYINNAHYNIFIYLIFAVVELPVYLFNLVFGTPVNERVLYFVGKLVSAGFFAACVPLIGRIGEALGLQNSRGWWAALMFVLWPPAFFSSMVMGQYDTLCLFFLLWAFLWWLRGDMLKFSFIMGFGVACKFFPLMLFLPLLLLREKRVLHLIKYAAISLWLLAPTTLLFLGRQGDMRAFNEAMISRLFEAKIQGAANIPLFPAALLLVCFVAYIWNPGKERLGRAGLWMGVLVFGLLFLLVPWHPQWVLLIAPFIVLSTLLESKNLLAWFAVDVALSAGFFIQSALQHAHQLEANLLDAGLIGILTGLATTSVNGNRAIMFYYNLLPVVSALPLVLFGAALVAHIVFKAPGKNGSLASRVAGKGGALYANRVPQMVWICSGLGMAAWLLPTLFTWLKAFSFI